MPQPSRLRDRELRRNERRRRVLRPTTIVREVQRGRDGRFTRARRRIARGLRRAANRIRGG